MRIRPSVTRLVAQFSDKAFTLGIEPMNKGFAVLEKLFA
jgi:hypothetical protein